MDLADVPPAARDQLLADLPTLGYIGNPLDPWGATDPPAAYDAAFRAFAGSGAYDVLALVHDFPYRSLPSEVETALEVLEPLLRATADRPDLLPVFVSLTSGEPTPEIVDALRAAGGVPVLRGTVEAFGAIAAVARWEAAHDGRLAAGPVRDEWPVLAADPPLYAHDVAARRPSAAPADPRAAGAGEPRPPRPRPGCRSRRRRPWPRPTRPPRRPLGSGSRSS